MYICAVMLMDILAEVKMAGSIFLTVPRKTAKPRVIVEVTEDEKLEIEALAFILRKPAAEIIRGLMKAEVARHRGEVDKAKKLIASRS